MRWGGGHRWWGTCHRKWGQGWGRSAKKSGNLGGTPMNWGGGGEKKKKKKGDGSLWTEKTPRIGLQRQISKGREGGEWDKIEAQAEEETMVRRGGAANPSFKSTKGKKR